MSASAISNWPAPVPTSWFFKGLPSRIGYLLDITLRELERVLYFEAFVVVDPGEATGLSKGEVISDERKRQLDQEHPGKFVAMMGAEGIKELLKRVGCRGPEPGNPREDEDRDLAAEADQVRQAPARDRVFPQVPATSPSG